MRIRVVWLRVYWIKVEDAEDVIDIVKIMNKETNTVLGFEIETAPS